MDRDWVLECKFLVRFIFNFEPSKIWTGAFKNKTNLSHEKEFKLSCFLCTIFFIIIKSLRPQSGVGFKIIYMYLMHLMNNLILIYFQSFIQTTQNKTVNYYMMDIKSEQTFEWQFGKMAKAPYRLKRVQLILNQFNYRYKVADLIFVTWTTEIYANYRQQ